MKDLYIPEIYRNLLDIDVWKWYKNIFLETKRDYLSIDEKKMINHGKFTSKKSNNSCFA